MSKTYVYLVPGFFGFVQLGAINYFHRVADTLQKCLRRRDVDAVVVECRTQPTGSIRNQADRLLQEVIDNGGLSAEALHFVGHSTGGLNARLLVSPGVSLRQTNVEEIIGDKTRSVVTLATPHFGTPLASFFTSFHGRQVLELLATLASSRPGRRTVFWASKILSAVARLDDVIGRRDTLLDDLADRLLRHLTLDPNDPIWHFLRDVSRDQGAIVQLTPEAMHIFNAAVQNRENVKYACLVTAAPPPRLLEKDNFRSMEVTSLSLLFAFLYHLVSREHRQYRYPAISVELASQLDAQLGSPVSPSSNDGIVPTLSQLSGEVIDAVVGDHLDIVGQFRNAGGNPNADWLPSHSAFDEDRFVRVWDGVAESIAKAGNS